MLIAGTEDGLYRVSNVANGGESTVEQVLDAGAVMRVRRFDDDNGVFAATESGLYYSVDGTEWEDLAVPEESVYSVAIDPEGTIYAGTRPARVFVSEMDSSNPTAVNGWRELDGFRELPSRDEWRLPRHENLAQVRDLHVTPEAPDRVVAGVEVGGVHVSDDGGQTWDERRNGVDDDIHELRVLDQNEFVAATGFGLFYSEDEGRSWTRLDEGVDQRYFRTVFETDGAIYVGSALAHTATWDDDDADPALFVSRDASSLDRLEYPRPDETITGITTVEGDLTVATHRGTILVLRRGEWSISGSLPASNQFAASYTPLEWVTSWLGVSADPSVRGVITVNQTLGISTAILNGLAKRPSHDLRHPFRCRVSDLAFLTGEIHSWSSKHCLCRDRAKRLVGGEIASRKFRCATAGHPKQD